MSSVRRRLALGYLLGVAVPATATVAVLAVASGGSGGGSGGAPTPGAGEPSGGFDVNHVLLAIAVVVAAAHAGGALAARLGQPRVVGQATVGLLLGPSALGQLAPSATAWIQGGGASRAIDVLAQLGIVLFVFLVGRELAHGGHGRATRGAALLVGQVMVAVPLLCGVAVAALLIPAPAGTGAVPHALFVGLAMSATALPVLAHILAERRLLATRAGATGTAAAAVGDAVIWCLLAVVMCLAQRGSLAVTALRFAAALAFAAALWWGLRPLARRIYAPDRDSRYALPGLLLCALLACAVAAERLGLHAIFGAFLVGLAAPQASVIVQRVTAMAEGATEWLLLPLFFTAIGSRTQLGLLTDHTALALCLVVLTVAVTSKLVSATAAGRLTGFGWRDSAALGVMMNCRGLTELLLLNLGRTAGIIDDRTFAVFVVMALVTTATTGPLLGRLGLTGSARPPGTGPRPTATAGAAVGGQPQRPARRASRE